MTDFTTNGVLTSPLHAAKKIRAFAWKTIADIGVYKVLTRHGGRVAKVVDTSAPTGTVVRYFDWSDTAGSDATAFAWTLVRKDRHAAATRRAIDFWSADSLVLAA